MYLRLEYRYKKYSDHIHLYSFIFIFIFIHIHGNPKSYINKAIEIAKEAARNQRPSQKASSEGVRPL